LSPSQRADDDSQKYKNRSPAILFGDLLQGALQSIGIQTPSRKCSGVSAVFLELKSGVSHVAEVRNLSGVCKKGVDEILRPRPFYFSWEKLFTFLGRLLGFFFGFSSGNSFSD
jgi:hypothetical protein